MIKQRPIREEYEVREGGETKLAPVQKKRKIKFVQECNWIPYEDCYNVPEKKCEYVTRETCKKEPYQDCNNVPWDE